jgi:hypothetical protein
LSGTKAERASLGVSPSEAPFQDNSTSGHEGSAPFGGKAGEKIASTADKQFDAASELQGTSN